MVGVEHRLHVGKFFGILGSVAPGKIHDPIEIIPNDGIFGRSRLGLVQPHKFLLRFLLHRWGQSFGKQFLAQFDAFLHVVAQFGMNGFELFAQEIFLLRFVDILSHALRDFSLQTRNFQFVVQTLFEQFESGRNAVFFQQFLFYVVFQSQEVRTHVNICVVIGDARQCVFQFFGNFTVRLHDVAHQILGGTERRLFEIEIAVNGYKFFHGRFDISFFRFEIPRNGSV